MGGGNAPGGNERVETKAERLRRLEGIRARLHRGAVEVGGVETGDPDKITVVAERIEHHAEVAALTLRFRSGDAQRRSDRRQNSRREGRRTDIVGLIVERRHAFIRVHDHAGGERARLEDHIGELARCDGPLIGHAFAAEDSGVVGGETAGHTVLELHAVGAVTQRGDDAILPKIVLRRDHRGVGELEIVGIAILVQRDLAGNIGIGADREAREGETRIALVVGVKHALGRVVTAEDMVGRILRRGVVVDRDIVLVDQNLLEHAADLLDLAGLRHGRDAMATEFFTQIEFVGGGKSVDFVAECGVVRTPGILHVEPADERIGGSATGDRRQRRVRIAAEIDRVAGHGPAIGPGLVERADKRALKDKAAPAVLYLGAVVAIEAGEQGAGAGEARPGREQIGGR